MTEQSKALIQETEEGLAATKKNIIRVQEARDFLTNKELPNARARLKRKKTSEVYPNKVSKKLIEGLKEASKVILMKEIDDALPVSGTEFQENEALYKLYLYLVAKDSDIYKLFLSGSGWSAKISPSIEFASVAGTLDDYARGIQVVRESHDVKVGKEGSGRGLHATNWWLKNVYGTSRYAATVEDRIESTHGLAPFWSLINHGSVGMASDRGDGSFNPFPSKGANFIEPAESKIKKEFETAFNLEKVAWEEEVTGMSLFVEEIEKDRDLLSSVARQVATDIRKNQQLFSSLDPKIKKMVDKNRLAEAARRFRAGEEYERVLISKATSGKKIYLTARQVEGFL
jgi:hypothetical protein